MTCLSTAHLGIQASAVRRRQRRQHHGQAAGWRHNAAKFSRVDGTGAALMFAHIGERNISAMLVGTAAAFLVIAVLLAAAFLLPRIGLISLVPNFAPGIIAFGLRSLVVSEVGIALSVAITMTIGIAVGDAVHFLSEYPREVRTRLHARRCGAPCMRSGRSAERCS